MTTTELLSTIGILIVLLIVFSMSFKASVYLITSSIQYWKQLKWYNHVTTATIVIVCISSFVTLMLIVSCLGGMLK